MSTTKHTPGPWKCDTDIETLEVEIWNDKDRIAIMDGNNKYDAKLIAAAPELLEALLMCVNAVGALADKSEPARNAWNKATAAIKKATE